MCRGRVFHSKSFGSEPPCVGSYLKRGLTGLLRLIIFLLLVQAWCRPAFGTEYSNLPPVIPPLEFFDKKQPLPNLLLQDKRSGSYITGFPAIGVDPDSGFTYGAALQWYNNGPTNSPFFRYTPYRQKLAVGATGSTGGTRQAVAVWDQPFLGDSPWRLRAVGVLQGVKFQNYFGIGSQTLNPLSFPGSPLTYTRYSDYYDAINKVQNGQTWSRYNSYYRQQAFGGITLERSCDGGLLRPLIGFQLSRIKVTDYTGDIINGAVEQPTLLYTDYQNGSITGFNGGWDNALKLGLTYDTRDFEPDPTQGVVLMLCSRIVGTWIGSTYDYEQLTLSARYFYNLLERPRRLIFAVRGLYSMEFGNIPFYSYPDMPFTDGDVDGLGGWNTLRGYKQNRFVGHDAAVLNGELRWTFGEANFVGQHLSFMLAPFVDSGCVFNSIAQSTFKDWKVDAGLGFRLAWNLSTVVSFDYAISSESALFNMQLGQLF
ncbi:MAG: DUF5982 domain-containing protein [Verrucomicrobiota bacterium]